MHIDKENRITPELFNLDEIEPRKCHNRRFRHVFLVQSQWQQRLNNHIDESNGVKLEKNRNK